MFLLLCFFCISNQTLILVILLFFIMVVRLPRIHTTVSSHWVYFPLIIIYLGGVLVLLFYFSSFVSYYHNYAPIFLMALFVPLWLINPSIIEAQWGPVGGDRGLIVLIQRRKIIVVCIILRVIRALLRFISFSLLFSHPIRQLY